MWMSKERIPKWTIWPEVVAETIEAQMIAGL